MTHSRLQVSEAAEPAPVINTTPLIDLMLVLLVIFIVSVPIATHKVPLDLPAPRPGPAAPSHRVDIDSAGNLSWDGRPIPQDALTPLLAQLVDDPRLPELHLAVDGAARYERVDETLAAIRRAGVTRMGFVGNERFAGSLDR